MFKTIVNREKNLPYIRHTRVQGPENIDSYITDLKNKDCEFKELHDSLIRGRIICGIRDDTVRARLLREDLSFARRKVGHAED